MKTALFAGDKASLQATPEQLKEVNRPTRRPADGIESDDLSRGRLGLGTSG